MINRLLAALVVCAGMGMSLAPAQAQTATSEKAMPEVKEAPAQGGESGLLSGEKPFTLMVDENVGELIYQFDEETKELESIHAKRGVIFASEDMTLNADEMEYKTINSSLVATGKRVVVRMGDMIVTCQLFKYNPETQEGQFEGHPIVYQRGKDGKVTETAGRVISIVNVNGKFQMRVGAGGGVSTYVTSSGVSKDSGTLEKKTLAPGQKGASMTINNNPSPGASGASASGAGAAGGLLAAPEINPGSAPKASQPEAPTAPGSAQIDPDNPADVQQYTDKKSE